MKILIGIILLSICPILNAEVIFPKNDPHRMIKLKAIEEINDIMGANNSARYVDESESLVLWANRAAVLAIDGGKSHKTITEPSFTPVEEKNRAYLRELVSDQCQCSIEGRKLAGVLIADPYMAAIMKFRIGWNGNDGSKVDGKVPPIVIIYHEFSHVKDYLSNRQWFLDLAASFDKRWKNGAERSASEQQNDFVQTLYHKRKVYPRLRRSYGKNELYKVEGLFTF